MVQIGISTLWPSPDCSRTALKLVKPYRVSIISQILSAPLFKCTRINRKLRKGSIMAIILR